MLPFYIDLKAGSPICDQLVYAVKKAIVSGQLKPGDRLPSVRALSQALKINPNTAQKAIAKLCADGLLQASPGIGCSVSIEARKPASSSERGELLRDEIERLVVEAMKLRIDKDDLHKAIDKRWSGLANTKNS